MLDVDQNEVLTDCGLFGIIIISDSSFLFRVALVEYKNISGKTLQESIEREMSGALEKLLVAIGKYIVFINMVDNCYVFIECFILYI